jgi:UDP-N-acetyl-D-galactosamine dehydrogenase
MELPPFKPGLVGGHCIGVDPYYLAQKAQEYGYHPEIILAGRRVNDSMGAYVASEVIKQMIKQGIQIKNSNVLILGITFKENCPDVRNTKVVDIIKELLDHGINITIHDPWANPSEVKHEYSLDILPTMPTRSFDATVLAVAHDDFRDIKFTSQLVYRVKTFPSIQ